MIVISNNDISSNNGRSSSKNRKAQRPKKMDDYVVLGRVGEGAHGIVMKARHRHTGEVVALKKVALKQHQQQQPQRMEEGGEGGLITEPTIREIKALQELNSIHVIRFVIVKLRREPTYS